MTFCFYYSDNLKNNACRLFAGTLSTLTASRCPDSALFARCCCGCPQIYILLSPSDDTSSSQGLCNSSLCANYPALHPCPEVHIFGSFYRKVSKTENLSRRAPPNIDISIHSENELHILHFSTSLSSILQHHPPSLSNDLFILCIAGIFWCCIKTFPYVVVPESINLDWLQSAGRETLLNLSHMSIALRSACVKFLTMKWDGDCKW